ncbi:hypothetical protein P9112_010309 [Eukaryota sp. TZLM1-RC]
MSSSSSDFFDSDSDSDSYDAFEVDGLKLSANWLYLHSDSPPGHYDIHHRGRGVQFSYAQSLSPVDRGRPYNYYELEVIDVPRDGPDGYAAAIGLVPERYSSIRLPGWSSNSIAYHGDDGKVFINSGQGESHGFPSARPGDSIGLLLYQNNVYFSHNGRLFNHVSFNCSLPTCYAAAGLSDAGERVIFKTSPPFRCSHASILSFITQLPGGSLLLGPNEELEDHYAHVLQKTQLDEFKCIICFSVVSNAVETNCCHQLICEACSRLSSCPHCRHKRFQCRPNYPIRRMVDGFEVICRHCEEHAVLGEFRGHYTQCKSRLLKCKVCQEGVSREEVIDHLVGKHEDDLACLFFN